MSRVLRGVVTTSALAGTVAVATYGVRRWYARQSDLAGEPEPFVAPVPPVGLSRPVVEAETPPDGEPAAPAPGSA
jgi:hypothetical protein